MPRDPGTRRSAPSAEVARRNRRMTSVRPRFEGLEVRSLLSADIGMPGFAPGLDTNETPPRDAIVSIPPSGVMPSESGSGGAGTRPEWARQVPVQDQVAGIAPSIVLPDPPAPSATLVQASTIVVDIEYQPEVLEHVLRTLETTESWVSIDGMKPRSFATLAQGSASWIVSEIIRESALLESLEYSGHVVHESELGLDGPGRPLVRMPDTEPMTMIGSVGQGEGPDYYAIRPGPHGLQLRFTAFDPANDLADLLMIFDAYEGLVVSCLVSDAENTVTIDIRSLGDLADRELIVRVGPDRSSSGSGQELYALTFLPIASSAGSDLGLTGNDHTPTEYAAQTPAKSTPDPGPARLGSRWDALPVSWEPSTAEPPQFTASIGTTGSSTEARSVPETRDDTVFGPLPALAAAPFGGILRYGDAATLIGRHEAAVIDLGLIDLMSAEDELQGRAGIDDETEVLSGDEAGASLPIVAATHPRVSIDTFPSENLDGSPTLAVSLTSMPAIVASDFRTAEPLDLRGRADHSEEPPSQQRVLRWTVAGLTALMAAHLLLPDLGLLLPMVRPSQRTRRRWLRGTWYRTP